MAKYWNKVAAAVIAVVMLGQLHAREWEAINLQDADIRTFIAQAAEMTGKSFVIDPRVKGKITVISKVSLDEDAVYELFLSVLSVHGFAAVSSGDVIKIIPDTGAKQNTLPLVTGRVDGEEMITRVIAISNSSAVELVPILRPLVPSYGHLAGVASANALIVTDHAGNVARIEKIIARIDGAGSEELEVIQLQDAWVGDVVTLLEAITPVQVARQGNHVGGPAAVKVVADERTNRLIIKGEAAARARIVELIAKLDVPIATSGAVQVIKLNNANAKDMAELLKGLIESGQQASGEGQPPANRGFIIQADEALNALVMRAEPSIMREIKAVISQLDVPRKQVLIEAAIVEVGGRSGRELGIQMATGNPSSGVFGTNLNAGNQTSLNSLVTSVVAKTPAALGGGLTGVIGESDSNNNIKWGAIVQAFASSSDVNLLSTPSLMTLDNQEASIVVGRNVPFVTGSSTSSSNGTSNPFTTIKREDVGIKLTVTPTITDDDTVRLVIEQEVSEVSTTAEQVNAQDIITTKREISTTVLADDGETIVLGGLIQDQVNNVEQKVPLLGDIPFIGVLFRSTTKSHEKTNLMVFLRPTILASSSDASILGSTKYAGLRALSFEVNDNGDVARTKLNALPSRVDQIYQGFGDDASIEPEQRSGGPAAPGVSGEAELAPVLAEPELAE